MVPLPPHDWPPTTSLDRLRLRDRILAAIRGYFRHRRVLEVETPLLSPAAATDSMLQSFAIRSPDAADGADTTLYLHTSPEFAMKRLLAAGSGPIYQICKVFRQGEQGRLHNPEFTMLEWYRPGYNHHDLMTEVEDLLREVLEGLVEIPAVVHWTYRELFQRYGDIDPFLDDIPKMRARLRDANLEPPPGMCDERPDAWRDLLLTHVIEPQLPQGLVFVYDFPVEQAALARLRPGDPAVAERFELYVNGVELANGYHELTDAEEQHRRMQRDLQRRQRQGMPAVPVDTRLLAALVAGLPDCAGVALGVDRLIMLAAGAVDIREIMPFPIDRA